MPKPTRHGLPGFEKRRDTKSLKRKRIIRQFDVALEQRLRNLEKETAALVRRISNPRLSPGITTMIFGIKRFMETKGFSKEAVEREIRKLGAKSPAQVRKAAVLLVRKLAKNFARRLRKDAKKPLD